MTLTCNHGETWLDALLRVAREADQEDEARAVYLRLRALGSTEQEAVRETLEVCGLVELADELEEAS